MMKLSRKPAIRLCVLALLAAIVATGIYLATILSPEFFLDPLSYVLPKHRLQQPPTHHFHTYKPGILISPGLSIEVLDQELDLQTTSGFGISSSSLNALGTSPSGSFIHEQAGTYSADAARVLAITPKGYLVLFLQESGIFRRNKFIATHTEGDTLFFPFGQVTHANVLDGTDVIGEFKKRPTTASTFRGYPRRK